MIIYLFGPDAYRRQEKLKWYSDRFKKKFSALTVDSFDLIEKEELNRLKSFSTAQSLFEDSKFGVLENVNEVEPKELENIFKLSMDSKTLTLVISIDKPLPKDYKLSGKEGIIMEEFSAPKVEEFYGFIKKEAARRDLKISSATISILAKNYSGDFYGAITELDKMALGNTSLESSQDFNFFALTSQLQRAGNIKNSLPALEKLLAQNEPAMLFNFLASRSNGVAKTRMADYDVAIKSGKLEYEEALLDLVVSH